MDKAELRAFLASLDSWSLFFGLLVVIGVAGEAWVSYMHWTRGKLLQTLEVKDEVAHESALAAAQSAAASATAEATKATDQANKAEAAASAERLAREKLEAQLADRALSVDQLHELTATLRAAGPHSLAILRIADAEPSRLVEPLTKAIREAGWTVAELTTTGTMSRGIAVMIAAEGKDDAAANQGAKALAAALTRAGLQPSGPLPYHGPSGMITGQIPAPGTFIFLMVGAK